MDKLIPNISAKYVEKMVLDFNDIYINYYFIDSDNIPTLCRNVIGYYKFHISDATKEDIMNEILDPHPFKSVKN